MQSLHHCSRKIGKGNNEVDWWLLQRGCVHVYEWNKLGLNTRTSAQTVAHWNNIMATNCVKFSHTYPTVFTRTGRTPLLFEYFPKSILDFKKLIFGNYNSFTVERLQCDMISDVDLKYLSKATDIGETSPSICYYQSILTSHHLMRQLVSGYAGWVLSKIRPTYHIMTMVMRNQSRYCTKKSSFKLT